MKKYDSAILQEILIGAVITLAFVTVTGLASNVIILLLGWCITLPAFAHGLANLNDQILWFTIAAVSLLFCVITIRHLMLLNGSNDAQYRIGHKLNRRFSPSVMALTVGIGCALHGLMCAGVAALSSAYLFFSGPVLYIARFIAKAEREFFAADTDSYPFSILLIAILIYILVLAAACCLGYHTGYRSRMALQEAKEAEDRRIVSADKTWSAADAAQTSRADEFGHTEKKEFLKAFDRRTEAAYRSLNRRRIVKTLLFLLLWIALDAFFAYAWLSSRENLRLSVDAMPFVALLIVPFWPMKLHRRFLGRTFYGTVVKTATKEEARPGRSAAVQPTVKRTQILTLRPDNGVPEDFAFPAGTHFDLSPGDRVFKLSAYPHPVPALKRTAVGCPRCGKSAEGRGLRRCPWCREPLAQWK